MSVRVMGAIFGLDLEPSHRFVLLALADNADHDGREARTGTDMLAWKTGYSDRQVRRILRDLEERGILEVTEGGKGGRGVKTTYAIHLEHVGYPPKPERWKTRTSRPGIAEPIPGHLEHQNPDICDTKPGHLRPNFEGTPFNLTVQEPSIEPLNKKTRANEFTPAELALPEPTREQLRERRDELFRAYCRGVGIGPHTAAYQVALNFVSGELTPEVVAVLEPAKFEAVARYALETWRADGFMRTPKIARVLEMEPEYDRWVADGRPAHGAPKPTTRAPTRGSGRRGMDSSYLDGIMRGEP